MQKNFNEGEIQSALAFIHEKLENLKLSHKDSVRAELVCEEALLRLTRYSDFGRIKYFKVKVRKSFGNVLIDLSVPGEDFDFAGAIDFPEDNEISPDSQEAIQNLLFRTFIGNTSFKHSGNFNTLTVTALRLNYSSLYKVLIALALAVITGLLMRAFLTNELCTTINNNVFALITEVFLDGLKMCAVPVVFFSIILCFADMGNLSGIKKAGIKLFTWFIILQVTAVLLSFGLVFLFGTGKGAGLSLVSKAAGGQNFSFSLKDMVADLMPDNLIRPFLEGDMIQLIILAVLTGFASGLAGAKSILRGCNEINAIFAKITGIFVKIVPLVVFCSVSSMIITTGFHTLISLLGVFFTILAGHALINIIYCLALKFFAGLKPSIMYKKFMSAIIVAFSSVSSNAAIPDSMTCAKRMGVSQKFYPFALPLGISINKEGNCIYTAVIVLSAINMYGLDIPIMKMILLLFSIIILVVATPSIAGSGPAALSVLFTQLGMPLDLIGPIIAVSAVEDMIRTPTNCLGNMTSTLIAAKGAGLLELEEYNRP